ncbi:MAG: hypothetical protein GVY15_13960 [Bacteroidetes bacterium]|jgi:hypothetical protein|nr:hypothetical protein [Bacteroidota bacterium]
MPNEQKAFVVKSTQHAVEGLAELNEHLAEGWVVEDVTSLGAAAAGEDAPALHFAALVIVTRDDDEAAAVAAAEEVEEFVEEVVEGDGATQEVADPGVDPGGDRS